MESTALCVPLVSKTLLTAWAAEAQLQYSCPDLRLQWRKRASPVPGDGPFRPSASYSTKPLLWCCNIPCFHGPVPPAPPVGCSRVSGVIKGQNEERFGARKQNCPLVMRVVLCKDWVKAEVEWTAFRNTDFVLTCLELLVWWGVCYPNWLCKEHHQPVLLFSASISLHCRMCHQIWHALLSYEKTLSRFLPKHIKCWVPCCDLFSIAWRV